MDTPVDLNGHDPSANIVSKLARARLATGVTSFAPTVITSPENETVLGVSPGI